MGIHKNQSGFSIIEVLLILSALGIIGFVGYYVYHAKQTSNKDYSAAASTEVPTYKDKTTSDKPIITQESGGTLVTFGTQGLTISSSADVAKLIDAGSELKAYFAQNVGKQVEIFGGSNASQTFTVYSLYGNYATGTAKGYHFTAIWGPKAAGQDFASVGQDAVGNIGALLTMQDSPMCSDLKAAAIPVELLSGASGACLDANGNLTQYDSYMQ
jgi:hypothetical protein